MLSNTFRVFIFPKDPLWSFSGTHGFLYQQSTGFPFIRFPIGDAFQHTKGRSNIRLYAPSVLIPRTPRVPSSSGPLLTSPAGTRSGPSAAGCRPAPGSQPEAFLPLRILRSRPAVRREGWRTRNCLPEEELEGRELVFRCDLPDEEKIIRCIREEVG